MPIEKHYIIAFNYPDYLKQLDTPDIIIRNYILRALHHYAEVDPQKAFERGTSLSNLGAVLLPLEAGELNRLFPIKDVQGVLTVDRRDIVKMIHVKNVMIKTGALK